MEATVGWCTAACRSRIRLRSRYNTDCHMFVTVTIVCINMGFKTPIWRYLWRKIKKEKKKRKKVNGVSNSTRFGYDPFEYAQNFDQGLMGNDFDDLSREQFQASSSILDKASNSVFNVSQAVSHSHSPKYTNRINDSSSDTNGVLCVHQRQ
ncbi:hypothetical protein L6452_33473 [Arctium lappa]|uniref:Uncharacterized protein n=1 Tax=Arctium lappa TaxID=4217 RepID=A0ACB8YG61_ARCLA|nr:hypothetical protein L6452_33473 [Arctium lappa]